MRICLEVTGIDDLGMWQLAIHCLTQPKADVFSGPNVFPIGIIVMTFFDVKSNQIAAYIPNKQLMVQHTTEDGSLQHVTVHW